MFRICYCVSVVVCTLLSACVCLSECVRMSVFNQACVNCMRMCFSVYVCLFVLLYLYLTLLYLILPYLSYTYRQEWSTIAPDKFIENRACRVETIPSLYRELFTIPTLYYTFYYHILNYDIYYITLLQFYLIYMSLHCYTIYLTFVYLDLSYLHLIAVLCSFRTGDRIVRVNNTNMEGLSHKEAVQTFRRAKKTPLRLIVYRNILLRNSIASDR